MFLFEVQLLWSAAALTFADAFLLSTVAQFFEDEDGTLILVRPATHVFKNSSVMNESEVVA